MRGDNRPVARKCQTDRFVQTVHRVGRKHTGTTTASRTGIPFHLCDPFIADRSVSRFDHSIDQIQMAVIQLTGFHRATGYKDSRDIEPHGCHQHTRSDLVAIADANHCIGFVGIHHILDAVRNNIARRKRIEHSVVSHRDAVVDSDRIELGCKATQLFDLRFYLLPDLMQMDMTGYKLGKRIHNGYDRFAELLFFQAVGAPQRTGSGHASALCAV